jgi:hypothetical protein
MPGWRKRNGRLPRPAVACKLEFFRLFFLAVPAQRDDLKCNWGETRLGNVEFLRGSIRKIDDASRRKDATIVDAYHDRFVGIEVSHPHLRAEWQGGMAGRHGVHVEAFAAGGPMPIEHGAVPGSDAAKKGILRSSFSFFGRKLSRCSAQNGRAGRSGECGSGKPRIRLHCRSGESYHHCGQHNR